MGGFIDATAGTDNPASDSEIRCGPALAALVAAKHTVVLLPPSGHRGAIGGSGATADFVVYTGGTQGGVTKPLREIQENENYSTTIDAYTPDRFNPGGSIAMVDGKLATQAAAVIVDLANISNAANRTETVNKIIAMVDRKYKGRMVIFHSEGKNRVHNPTASFATTGDQFI